MRPRRNRADAWTRRLVAESRLTTDDLILPVFDAGRREPARARRIHARVERLSLDLLVAYVAEAVDLGIPAVALFPVTPPELKTRGWVRSDRPRQPDVPNHPHAEKPVPPIWGWSATWRWTPTPATAMTG